MQRKWNANWNKFLRHETRDEGQNWGISCALVGHVLSANEAEKEKRQKISIWKESQRLTRAKSDLRDIRWGSVVILLINSFETIPAI